LKKQVLDVVVEMLVREVFRASVSFDELRSMTEAFLDDELLGQIIEGLRGEGKLLAADGGYRIPNCAVTLPPNLGKLGEQMLDYAQSRGYGTFTARTFCELHWKTFNVTEIYKLLEYLRKRGKLVRLTDGRYMTSPAMEEIKEKVGNLIRTKGSLTVQDSKEILGYGRNRGVPVLEYLDSIGFTSRVDNVRVLGSTDRG
jgi:selenocysteine-specific elongation factor